MNALKVDIAPEVRADLDRGAAAAGYMIQRIDDFTLLKPTMDVPDPLGTRGYFGFNGRAIGHAGNAIKFGCLWRIEEEGNRYRIVNADAERELGLDEGETKKGWLPDPTRAVLESAGLSWRMSYDVSRETVSQSN